MEYELDKPSPTVVGSLDLSTRGDRLLLYRSLGCAGGKRKKWEGLEEGLKDKLPGALAAALAMATDRSSIEDITRIAKIVLEMNAQNQADDHLEEKHARLDAGLVTERVENTEYRVVFDNEANAEDKGG